MNLEEFRKVYTVEEKLKYAASQKFQLLDQDILNKLCEGSVRYLDMTWNMMVDYAGIRKNQIVVNAPAWLNDMYLEARKKPKIIHYAGSEKPWNVISITDGQIFLESDLFFSGMRPAVNVGLSVSRVGGAAQTKAMKKAAGSIRIDLAQFREMEVFTQFASDLDNATKEQLQHGHVLMELLKQPLCRPLSMAEQVMTLCAANGRVMLDVPVDHVKDFQMQFLSYMKEQHSDIVRQLETTKALDDELNKQICDAAEEFKKEFLQK